MQSEVCVGFYLDRAHDVEMGQTLNPNTPIISLLVWWL